MDRLKELKIEVTYRCPLICSHCSSDAFPDNPCEMDYQLCSDIITEAHQLGVEKLAFSGGEPLIWDNISAAVGVASKLGIITSIYTSGNIISRDDTPERIFSDLKKSGLNKAIFSLYASDANKHEKITRKYGSFERTVESIRFCNGLKITTEVHFVATSLNYLQLPKLCEFASSLGVNSISILRFVPQGRGELFSEGLLTKKQNLELINLIKKLKNEGYDIRTGSPMNVFYLNKAPTCLAGIDRLIISPDLKIYPCDAFKQIDAYNITGTNQNSELNNASLTECWEQSPYLCKIRNVLASPPVGKCASCSNISRCNTGCLAQKFLTYGKLERCPDPACLLE